MEEACVSEPGAPCLHESFLFAVGETRNGTVELDLYQSDGHLAIVTLSGFSSWRRVRDADRNGRAQALPRVAETVLIDCVTRQAHCLTVRCTGLDLLFFGSEVRLETEHLAEVEPPHLFGIARGNEYRRRYAHYFTDRRKREGS